MSERFEEYQRLRATGLTSNACAKPLGVSSAACQKMEHKLRRLLQPDQYAALSATRSTKNELLSKVKALEAEIAALRQKEATAPIAEGMNPTSIGMLAEDLVYYQLRRRGFEVMRPMAFTSGTDLMVIRPDRYLRVEVKATTDPTYKVTIKCGRYDDGYKQSAYEAGLVDFFCLVDLKHENVFVLPAAEVVGMPTYVLSPKSRIWANKDRYDLLTA